MAELRFELFCFNFVFVFIVCVILLSWHGWVKSTVKIFLHFEVVGFCLALSLDSRSVNYFTIFLVTL